MAGEQKHKEAETLLAHASLRVPASRMPGLTVALGGTIAQLSALTKYDYGLTEPASRFRAPR